MSYQGYPSMNSFFPREGMGFFFFAEETQSLEILANRKDEDIEERSLKQRVSLK